MRRGVFFPLVVLASLLISGCWNGRLLIAAEQPWWAAQGGGAVLRRPLVRTSLLHGYLPRFLVIGAQEDPAARLDRELRTRHYAAAVVSPLLSLDPRRYAPSVPTTRFLLVEGPPQAPGLPNAIPLSFDHAPSLRTAGRAAALSILDEAGGSVSSAFGSRIGVLVSARPPGTDEEIEAFVDGVSGAMDGGLPVIRRLSDPVDRNAVRSAIDGMRRDGVEIFLLFMGAPDSWALEDMKSSGGCAIVSDWQASGAFPQQVFLSVETDLVGGVSRFLSHQEDAGRVSGPVHIVAGKARSIPLQIASQVRTR